MKSIFYTACFYKIYLSEYLLTELKIMSSTKRYCSCNPKSKPDREEAKWYCFRHRRHLCDNCIYDELNQRHISCLVGTYNEFIQSSPSSYTNFKKNKLRNPCTLSLSLSLSHTRTQQTNRCPCCKQILPDDDARAVIRLNCGCVYFANCLREYLLSHPTNNVPCKQCSKPIISSSRLQKKTNLSESVDKFLRSVSRQRLWSKHKKIASANNNSTKTEKEERGQRHSGHIVLDTTNINTRHRAVKSSSLNRDGNNDDDKYNKPPVRKSSIMYSRNSGNRASWFTRRKVLLIVLLLLMLIGQCWFIYAAFIKTNHAQNGKQPVTKIVTAKHNDVESVLKDLPKDLREEILGNKAKYQEMKRNRIK